MPLMDHRHLERVAGSERDHEFDEPSSCARTSNSSRPAENRTAQDGGELFRRARFLKPDDRLLIELAFKNQLSIRQIGRALRRPPGSISRRIMRLCRHLRDPNVLILIDPAFPFPLSDAHRQLAIEHFVQLHSTRQLAELHQMPIHEVRRVLSYVKGWCKGIISSGRAR